MGLEDSCLRFRPGKGCRELENPRGLRAPVPRLSCRGLHSTSVLSPHMKRTQMTYNAHGQEGSTQTPVGKAIFQSRGGRSPEGTHSWSNCLVTLPSLYLLCQPETFPKQVSLWLDFSQIG